MKRFPRSATPLAALALVVLGLGALPQDARAQFKVGPYTGLTVDEASILFGLGTYFDIILQDVEVTANFGFDYLPFKSEADGFDLDEQWRLYGNLLLPVRSESFEAFFGPGITLERDNRDLDPGDDFQNSDNDFGLNLKAAGMIPLGDSDFQAGLEASYTFLGIGDLALRAVLFYSL